MKNSGRYSTAILFENISLFKRAFLGKFGKWNAGDVDFL
jgi:hypothetical protein